MRPQWPCDLLGLLGSSPDSSRGSQGNPTLRYTGARLRADALVASAFQESAGGAKQQQQLAYLFHQCAMSLLSRDSRIADCTVIHPGVERQFSILFIYLLEQ